MNDDTQTTILLFHTFVVTRTKLVHSTNFKKFPQSYKNKDNMI